MMKRKLKELLEQQSNEQLRQVAATAKVILKIRRMKLWSPTEQLYAGYGKDVCNSKAPIRTKSQQCA